MDIFSIAILAGMVIMILMTVLWLVSLQLGDASIVDIFWGSGFVITGWIIFNLTTNGFAGRKWLLVVLVTIWGLRLSLHILRRNWGKGEDFRYRAWRRHAGAHWWWQSYFQVFLLQGLLLWLISAPLLAAQISPSPDRLTLLDGAAVVIWGIGFTFEAAGDWQLARFKSDPANRGKLLAEGVWRYTRHPNYFGDAAQWWAYFMIAAAAGGWWSIFSPLLMTLLLVKVSGAALLEKSLKKSKPGYEAYVQTTSAFIPWFPRKPQGHEG